jgi:hypothetical protein
MGQYLSRDLVLPDSLAISEGKVSPDANVLSRVYCSRKPILLSFTLRGMSVTICQAFISSLWPVRLRTSNIAGPIKSGCVLCILPGLSEGLAYILEPCTWVSEHELPGDNTLNSLRHTS